MAVTAPEVRVRRQLRPLWWGVLAAVLLLGVLAGLWFLLPIRSVTVSGNKALSDQQVLTLAGLTPPFYGSRRSGGWLFYGGWRARALRSSPWVQSAQIVRRFPGKLEIAVTERTPAARWQQPGGQVFTISGDGVRREGVQPLSRIVTFMPDGSQLEGVHKGGNVYTLAPNGDKQPGIHPLGRVVTVIWDGSERPGSDAAGKTVTIAWDGTVLPNTKPPPAGTSAGTPPLPLLIGWGPDRLQDARRAALLLSSYNVLSVRYTPSGITVVTKAGTVWSGSLDSLLKYSGGVKMFANQHINIYPWGVSVQQ